MSEEDFWNCTHKKLHALLKIHNKIYGDTNSEVGEVYGDTISL